VLSKVEDQKEQGEETLLWTCEFCNYKNIVSLDKEEIPQTKEVNYILEAAA
jgi:hypothetical protein